MLGRALSRFDPGAQPVVCPLPRQAGLGEVECDQLGMRLGGLKPGDERFGNSLMELMPFRLQH